MQISSQIPNTCSYSSCFANVNPGGNGSESPALCPPTDHSPCLAKHTGGSCCYSGCRSDSLATWHHKTRTEDRQTGATRIQATPSLLSDKCLPLWLAIKVLCSDSSDHTPAWWHSLGIRCSQIFAGVCLFRAYHRLEVALSAFNKYHALLPFYT